MELGCCGWVMRMPWLEMPKSELLVLVMVEVDFEYWVRVLMLVLDGFFVMMASMDVDEGCGSPCC